MYVESSILRVYEKLSPVVTAFRLKITFSCANASILWAIPLLVGETAWTDAAAVSGWFLFYLKVMCRRFSFGVFSEETYGLCAHEKQNQGQDQSTRRRSASCFHWRASIGRQGNTPHC